MEGVVASGFSVSGHVQGVGFRAYVASVARDLELAGEVWNTRQGGVEGFVQGYQPEIDRFMRELSRGPGGVINVSKHELEPKLKLHSFSIGPTR